MAYSKNKRGSRILDATDEQITGTDVGSKHALDVAVTQDALETKTPIKKTLDWTGSITGSTLWQPAAGKYFVMKLLVIKASAACTVTIFDHTDNTTNRFFKGYLVQGGGGPILFPGKSGKGQVGTGSSGILKITTDSSGGYVTAYGYEEA